MQLQYQNKNLHLLIDILILYLKNNNPEICIYKTTGENL